MGSDVTVRHSHDFNCTFGDLDCGKDASWVRARDCRPDGRMRAGWSGEGWCDEHRPDGSDVIIEPDAVDLVHLLAEHRAAVAEIERLRTENARLTKENQRLRNRGDGLP